MSLLPVLPVPVPPRAASSYCGAGDPPSKNKTNVERCETKIDKRDIKKHHGSRVDLDGMRLRGLKCERAATATGPNIVGEL